MSERMSDSRVDELHAKLLSTMDPTLTKDEAIEVWWELHMWAEESPRTKQLLYLQSRLDGELNRGKRCGVCGRAGDKQCWTEC